MATKTQRMAPVVWLSYHKDAINKGYWDQALLEEFLEGYEHVDNFEGVEGAVVIINGRMHINDVPRLNKDLSKLSWVLLIETGDEEALFPITEVKHPNMKVWVQLPRMGQHDHTSHLPNGYRPTTKQELKLIGQQSKTLDWFFAGQSNHPRRTECIDVLQQMSGGELVVTHSFGDEKIDYHKYMTKLAQAKIAPCPSGIESPDSFRVYEALEAGCIPVVDAHSTNWPVSGFWKYLLGNDVPFPIISEWSAFPSLEKQLLSEWPRNANRIFAWWLSKKNDIKHKLESDIWTLQH